MQTGIGGALATVGVGALLLAGGGTAAAGDGAASAKRGADYTIAMVQDNGGLRFEDRGGGTIGRGAKLRIVNETDSQQVGPHTFSLVTKKHLPKTRAEQRRCFEKGEICRRIARWHGSDGQSPPTREVARARRPGWDTMGTTRRRGDSWVTQQEGSEFSQSTTSRRDHVFYMCAIHPDMQGRLNIAQPLR